jgi:hypothetical protein
MWDLVRAPRQKPVPRAVPQKSLNVENIIQSSSSLSREKLGAESFPNLGRDYGKRVWKFSCQF